MKIHCAYDTMELISTLKPHPKNANKHPKEQIERLAKILEYQGFRYPIKISKQTGFVTSGHGRIEAAKLNGWHGVPVSWQDYETPDMELADLHADNAIASWAELDLSVVNDCVKELDPTFDIELLGIKNFEIDVVDKFNDDEDSIPEVPKEPKTKLGDLYVLGNHRLMCNDSTDILHVECLMEGLKADMVFTDPPYGMGIVKKDGQNNSLGESINGVVGVAARGKYRPVMGDDSTKTAIDAYGLCVALDIPTMVFWGANFYAEALMPSPGWIVWDKENGEGFFADGELAWTNSDKQLRIFKHQWKGMIRDSERGDKRIHPTQKPIALAEWCFENYGNPMSVLDLFGGSGSTLIACEKTNRKCLMMELDPHYCDVIIERWQKFTGQTANRLTDSGELVPYGNEA